MIHTTRFSPFRNGVQRKLLTKRVEIGVVSLSLTLIVLTCVLSILLLLHANKVATRGYELRSLQVEVHDLNLIHQRLLAEISRKQSLVAISSNDFVKNNMVGVNNLVVLTSDNHLVQK